MKFIAAIMLFIGGLAGLGTSQLQKIHYISSALFPPNWGLAPQDVTIAASVIGLIAAVSSLVRPRAAALLAFLAAILGVFGAVAIWMTAGSLLFLGGILALFPTPPKDISPLP